jgi:hypothetical protein
MLHMPVYLLDGNSGDVPVGDAPQSPAMPSVFSKVSPKRCAK